MKYLLSILMVIKHVCTSPGDEDGVVEDHGDGDGTMQVENEKWFMQSFATGLRGKERKQQAAGPRCPKTIPEFSTFAPESTFDLKCDPGWSGMGFVAC